MRIWSLLANVYVEFHVWTGVLCALLALAATLAVGLFLRFPGKLEVALAVAALVLATVIGNHAFRRSPVAASSASSMRRWSGR